jgi:hypothetical protein
MRLFALIAMAGLSLAACERRDGKVIFHEDEAKQKTQEAAQKTGEEAKKLGHELKNGAEQIGKKVDEHVDEHPTDPAAKGGGPTCGGDAGPKSDDCP